jgi:hypothetical protein
VSIAVAPRLRQGLAQVRLLMLHQLLMDGLPARPEGIADMAMKRLQVTLKDTAVEFNFDVAACSDTAEIRQTDFLGQTNCKR